MARKNSNISAISAFRLFDQLKEVTTTSYSLKRIQDILEKSIQTEVEDDSMNLIIAEIGKLLIKQKRKEFELEVVLEAEFGFLAEQL